MGRLRSLKPEFFTHDLLSELSPLHRLLYEGLWCYADREGRLEDRPRLLKTVILPYDNCDVGEMLTDLQSHGFIQRYEVSGHRYIAIPSFLKHQRPHPKERPSDIPAPPQPHEVTVAAEINGEPRKGMVEPRKDAVEQCGLGDLCLGDLCLGEVEAKSPRVIRDGLAAPNVQGPTAQEGEQVQGVYLHYRVTFQRRHLEPNADEREVILDRLRDGFEPDELCLAVDGLRNSEWHRKRGFLALRYALGDRDSVERCMVWARAPPDEQEASSAPRFDPNQGMMRGTR